MYYCYVLVCEKDNSYYVGATGNVQERLRSHKNGEVKYTKSRLPIHLIFVKEFSSYSRAFAFEERVKSWKKRASIEKMLNKPDNIADSYCGVV